jgi:hypothetical protein
MTTDQPSVIRDVVAAVGDRGSIELDDEFAKLARDYLKSKRRNTDGYGEVHDLSDEICSGSWGYSFPGGVLAVVPPLANGERWTARYAKHPIHEEAPPEAIFRLSDWRRHVQTGP